MTPTSQEFPPRSMKQTGSPASADAVHFSRTTLVAFFILAIILLTALQAGGLFAPMYYDSGLRLQQNEHVFARGNVIEVINLFPSRFVSMTSFYVNYLFGGMDPFHFRILNIVLLACTALFVFMLLQLILTLAGIHGGQGLSSHATSVVSFLLALYFLLHPLQIYVTLYVWQRAALLACLLCYACLFVYLGVRTGRIRKRAVGYATCLAMFLLAMGSKEIAATVPVVLVLAEISLLKAPWKQVAARTAIFAGILLVSLTLLSHLQRAHGISENPTGILTAILAYYEEAGLSPYEVLLTQARVLFMYIRAFLVPLPSYALLMSPQEISTSLLEPPHTLLALIGALAFLSCGLLLLRKRPLTGFGILFFLICLSPDSLLVPQYQYFGYRLILPMLGLLIVVADVARMISSALDSRPKVRSALVITAAAWVVLAASVTASMAFLWGDKIRFWRRVVDSFPEENIRLEKVMRAQAYTNLGVALQNRGKKEGTLELFLKAAQLMPHVAKYYVSIGTAYVNRGDYAAAEKSLRRALSLSPDNPRAHAEMATALIGLQKLEPALGHARKAVTLAPHDASSHNALGCVLSAFGEQEKALKSFRRAVKIAPQSATARFNLGKTLTDKGLHSESIVHLKKATSLNPTSSAAHNTLGVALARSGRTREAVKHFRHALTLKPTDAIIRRNLQNAVRDATRTGN